MRRRIGLALVLAIAVVVSTWPLILRLPHSVPKGKESSATVAVLNLWTIGWNLDRVRHGWRDYWNAPHFFPTPHTLALSEPLVTSQGLVGLSGLPLPVAYNVFLLGALWLNGGAVCWVLCRRHVGWPAALLAGVMMTWLPFVHWQLGTLQCVLVAGIVATIHFADRALAQGRPRDFWFAAAGFDLTLLTCSYFGVFLALLFPAWGAVLIWQHRRTIAPWSRCRQWLMGLAGLMLLLAAAAPIVATQARVLSDPSYSRPRAHIQELSAKPRDYLRAPFPEWFSFVGLSQWHERGRWSLSPGLLKCVLAAFGIVVGLRRRRRRAWTLAWVTLAVGGFVGSLGLNGQLGPWSPYGTLLDVVPSLTRLRTPARFSVLVHVAAVMLAAEFLHEGFRRARVLARRSRGCWRVTIPPQWRVLPYALVWLIGLTACCEVRLPKLNFVDVPSVASQQTWIDWLRSHTDANDVIAHVPFPAGPLPKDYEPDAWAMYWSLFHQRRLVNGYSGFFPPSFLELKSQMQSFPRASAFATLKSRGVSICVVPIAYADQHQLWTDPTASAEWELAVRDDRAGVALFRLRR